MALPQESVSMALFCDFENVALGVRDAKFEKFDIGPVLERLLLKGSIVVKKAYCDWDRYKAFKASMHEASFELIEIPHVRQSGKNSADIRLVVDALDLCYTKSHVDTFVIISGDSDFSPLVSKLRENAKKVIGVGVKNSTSDLLVANCDEFIFYDDLVREQQRANAKRETREANVAARRSSDEDKQPKHEVEARKTKAIALAVETFDALSTERGESGKIWASVLKSAIKRRKPDFNESYYGFRAFGNLLDEAQSRGLLEVGRDDKSGSFVFRSNPPIVAKAADPAPVADAPSGRGAAEKGRRKGRNSRKQGVEQVVGAAVDPVIEPVFEPVVTPPALESAPAIAESTDYLEASENAPTTDAAEIEGKPKRAAPRRGRKTAAKKAGSVEKAEAEARPAEMAQTAQAAKAAKTAQTADAADAPEAEPAAKRAPARKTARRPRKTAAATER